MRMIDDLNERARRAYDELTAEQKQKAVCDLIDAGMSEYGAASATGLSVEMVRQILAERNARE